ncbi:MAG TPA: hypothetical protein VNF99_00465, partial [Stellaceae bacterium]|nr:hypothetical protein [Stellaceae bacterium]
TALTVSIAPALLWIVIGIAFYHGARRIVDRSLAGQQQGAAPLLDARAIEEVAVAVLGLYILASGIAEGVFYWARLDLFYRYAAGMRIVTPAVPQAEFGGIAAATTRIVLGLALFFLSRGLTALRRRLLDARPMARIPRDEASDAD